MWNEPGITASIPTKMIKKEKKKITAWNLLLVVQIAIVP